VHNFTRLQNKSVRFMTTHLKDFQDWLATLLAVGEFQDCAFNGLQVEGRQQIRSLGLATSASLNVIEQAATLGVDALLCHHGLFWKGQESVVTGPLRKKLATLLSHNINLFAYHLPLDAHRELGNNWPAARALGGGELEPFCIYEGSALGVKGQMAKIHRDEFRKKMEEFYGVRAHVALGGRETVSSFALVSGGAHSHIRDAVEAHVDCFITGSYDEYVWHIAHEEKINFFALGHAATEKLGVRLLGEHLESKFGIKVTFIDEPNPF
jgi:dinuclear metal center YbgI/SA1388 family protein